MKPLLSVKNITKKYGKNLVLDGVSLDVYKHDIVVLCGPSGGGKSTLVRTMNGLEPINSGEIYYNDTLLTKKTKSEFRLHIGMVFQSFNLFSNLSVAENLLLAPVTVKKMPKEVVSAKMDEYLNTFNIPDKKNSYPHELSGGQQQRVAIIRSLLMEPEIMLFDEPTSALDPEMIKGVLDVMRLLSKQGMTMVIVTHEMSFAREVATRMGFLSNGKIDVYDNTQDFFTNPDNERLKHFLAQILTH